MSIPKGQSETFNEGKQRDMNMHASVYSHAKLPGNWKNVLRNDDNKDELFQFLGHECVSKDTGDKFIVSTLLDGVVSSRDGWNTDLHQPCSHEEADTRMLLHVKDAMN